MGRGSSHDSLGSEAVRGIGRPGAEFPAPELDPEHPISDLWGLVGNLGPSSEERRCLNDYLLLPPLNIDGRPQPESTPRHSQMRGYLGPGGEAVLVYPLSRRARLSSQEGEQLGTVGDYLVQADDGSARIVRRSEFKSNFKRIEAAGRSDLYGFSVRVSEVRQALVEGRLDDAFADLRQNSELIEHNLEFKALSESLLEESWRRATISPADLRRAEAVTDWLGQSSRFAGTDLSAVAPA